MTKHITNRKTKELFRLKGVKEEVRERNAEIQLTKLKPTQKAQRTSTVVFLSLKVGLEITITITKTTTTTTITENTHDHKSKRELLKLPNYSIYPSMHLSNLINSNYRLGDFFQKGEPRLCPCDTMSA